MELAEQGSDPNLTQMPHQESQNILPNSLAAVSTGAEVPTMPGTSKQKVAKSLNNIASLQTGLQLKRAMAEEDHTQPLPAPTNGALNLLRYGLWMVASTLQHNQEIIQVGRE